MYIGIKKGDLFNIDQNVKLNMKGFLSFIKRYIQCSVYLTLLNMIYILIIPNIYINNMIFFMLINLFLVLTIFKYKIFYKLLVFIPTAFAMVILAIILRFNTINSFDYKVYVLLLFVIIFRKISEKYNYTEIQTSDIKPGMILSFGTIILFKKSKVNGLPQNTTEDMRSKISVEEAKSIIRWEKSKYGEKTVIIVRKMPFAIFIILGILSYVIIRMWIQ